MSRFGYSDSFSTNRSAQECYQAALEAFSFIGCRPSAGTSAMEITGKMGMGWAIRLIGGLIAPATWFPVAVSVAIHDAGDRREVLVRADENFGFGTLLGVEGKMRGRCDYLGKNIVSLLKSRLG